jgi:hypothetical protein
MKSKRMVRTRSVGAAAVGLAIGVMFVSTARADDPTSVSRQGQANRLSLFHDYSLTAYGSSRGDIPGQPGGGLIASRLGSWTTTTVQTPEDRNWSISGTPLLGYDSNPEGRQFSKSSVFAGAEANARYTIDLDPDDPTWGGPTRFVFNYNVGGALYQGSVSQANVIQQSLSAAVRHGFFDDTFVVSGLFQDQFTFTQGRSFLNTLDVVPSGELFWLPQFSTEVIYDFTSLEYFYPVASTQDLTGARHTLTGNLHFYTLPHGQELSPPEAKDRLTEILRKTFRQVTLGFAHVWNLADGTSYRYESNRIIFGLQDVMIPKVRDLSFDLQYAHEWQNYKFNSTENPPVLGGSPSGFRRKDDIDIFTLRANARLADLAKNRGTLGAFFQWDVISDGSNVNVRNFSEFIVSTGVVYRY